MCLMGEFEQAARLQGYTNFRREAGRYCHADLETFYKGWVKGRAALSQQPEPYTHCSCGGGAFNGHTAECQYEHFLSYSNLKDQPLLRYAYIKGIGGECDQPECCKAQVVELEVAATYVQNIMRAIPSGLVPLADEDQLVRLADAQHLLFTERAEAERKMAEKDAEIARLQALTQKLDDQFQREVYGLNNEGDPIGGEPVGGYINDLARLRARVAELESLLRNWYPGCGLTKRRTQELRERTDGLLNPPQANSQEVEK